MAKGNGNGAAKPLGKRDSIKALKAIREEVETGIQAIERKKKISDDERAAMIAESQTRVAAIDRAIAELR